MLSPQLVAEMRNTSYWFCYAMACIGILELFSLLFDKWQIKDVKRRIRMLLRFFCKFADRLINVHSCSPETTCTMYNFLWIWKTSPCLYKIKEEVIVCSVVTGIDIPSCSTAIETL